MTVGCIHVASYSSLDDARLDWDEMVRDPCATADLVDAVLVEVRDGTVGSLHRFWLGGDARGAVAGAVVGLLLPSALVCGALAGGVGEQTISVLVRAVPRSVVAELGRLFDRRSVAIVAV